MTTNRHAGIEELISASLTGDLTAEEQRRLEAHLAGCEACTATLAAFTDQRRVVGGLRSIAPPRDLGARVRTGIESGSFAPVPWWRRPAAIFAGVGGGLAVVAGALLALVLLNGQPGDPEVGRPTPSPVPGATATATPAPTLPPILPSGETPPPSAAPTPTPEGSAAPTAEPSPEPDVYLALTGDVDNLTLTVLDGTTNEAVVDPAPAPGGEPVAAELSSDGAWLAYLTRVGESGLTDLHMTRLAEGGAPSGPGSSPAPSAPVAIGETVDLGESIEGGPFVKHIAWSPDGRYLAYTVTDPEGAGTDVWVFDTTADEPQQLTDVGSAYVGSWVAAIDGELALWISVAGEQPISYLWALDAGAGLPDEPIDPAEDAVSTAEGVFQPLLSPNGRLAIYWTGVMDRSGDEWVFSEGGAPYLAEHPLEGDDRYTFVDARPLFSDLVIDRDAFTSAAIAWGPDGDAYAVWDAAWTGIPQGEAGTTYPDRSAVYLGHATDSRGLTRVHRIDVGDIPSDAVVVDVKVAPTGRHLAITVLEPTGGIMEAPRATLYLVERHTGDVPDVVSVLGSSDDGWFGPAAFVTVPQGEGDR